MFLYNYRTINPMNKLIISISPKVVSRSTQHEHIQLPHVDAKKKKKLRTLKLIWGNTKEFRLNLANRIVHHRLESFLALVCCVRWICCMDTYNWCTHSNIVHFATCPRKVERRHDLFRTLGVGHCSRNRVRGPSNEHTDSIQASGTGPSLSPWENSTRQICPGTGTGNGMK